MTHASHGDRGSRPLSPDLRLGKELLKRPNRKDNLALESGDVLFIPPKKERGPKRSALDYLGFLFGLF